MTRSLFRQFTFGSFVLAAMYAVPAQATATRTWVSATGNDADPCSFTAPCKTLAAALLNTTTGGEISVIGSGGYGSVLIDRSVTINGEGSLASILATGSTGITVAAGPNDRVILRNLHINGAISGSRGIHVSSAGSVTIDNCFIYGFTTGIIGGVGVNIAASATVQVDVRNTNITNTSHGFIAQTSGGAVIASIDNVRMNDLSGYGVGALSNGIYLSVRNSFIKNAGVAAIFAQATAQINVDHSEMTNSGAAVKVTAAGATVRLNDNGIYNNTVDLAISGGGTVATASNNKTGGNGAGGVAPNGTVGNL